MTFPLFEDMEMVCISFDLQKIFLFLQLVKFHYTVQLFEVSVSLVAIESDWIDGVYNRSVATSGVYGFSCVGDQVDFAEDRWYRALPTGVAFVYGIDAGVYCWHRSSFCG